LRCFEQLVEKYNAFSVLILKVGQVLLNIVNFQLDRSKKVLKPSA